MNIFLKNENLYAREFKTIITKSRYDRKSSLHLIYREFENPLGVKSMHDEIRQLNKNYPLNR